MGWYGTLAKGLLAAGVVILGVGCNGREKVALGAKDETIRNQDKIIAQERDDKDKLSASNKALADQNQDLITKNAEIAKLNADRTAQLSQQVADLQSLVKDLGMKSAAPKSGDDGTGVVAQHSDNTIHITVASSTFFDAGKADLKPSAHAMLNKICQTLKTKFPGNYIRVEGHTDSTPVVHNKNKFPDNMALSIARSRAVYDYMIKSGGIAASKMYTAGYGQFQPLVHPERTAADRAKNRRVEIVIMPNTVKVQKEQLAEVKPAAASTTARKK